MFIVVVGGGYVGERIVKYLTARGDKVAIVEKDDKRCDELSTRYEAMIFTGDGTKEESFRGLEMSGVDALFAVTTNDDENLAACRLSKAKFGVPYVIARVNDAEREEEFKRAGADVTICPLKETLASFENAIERRTISVLFASREETCRISLVRVPSDGAAIGKSMEDLELPKDCRVCAICRRSGLLFPSKETVVQADDQLFVIGSPQSVEKAEHRLTSPF